MVNCLRVQDLMDTLSFGMASPTAALILLLLHMTELKYHQFVLRGTAR